MEIINEYINKIAELGFESIGSLTELDDVSAKPDKLCLGLECLDRDLWEFDRAFPVIEKIGIHRVRLQTGWQKTEKTEGIYDFEWLDNVVDKLLSADIIPFLSLSYGNKLYCENVQDYPNIENGGIGHIPVKTDRERKGWQNYVEAVVNHFNGRITHYEIFNEPDCSTFCHVDMPWTEAYMELIKITAPIIRKLQPDAKIISCTASSTAVQLLADMGLGDYVDIHSFHAYSAFPELSPTKALENRMSYAKEKSPNLRFWRGEAGFPSYNDPKSKGALSGVKVSETKQAKFLLRHITCDMQSEMIECTSYFHAYDFLHFTKTHRYHYGIIRHEDLSRKPSYDCLQVLARLFDGSVVPSNDCGLSFINKSEFGLAESKAIAMKFASFKKCNDVFFAYWLPEAISDDTTAYKIMLNMPCGKIKNPVILDPLTRNIYPIANTAEFLAPVTDYPMFVIDADMVKDFAKLNGESKKEEIKIKVEQFFEQ